MTYIVIAWVYSIIGTALGASFFWDGLLPHERPTLWGISMSLAMVLAWLPALIFFSCSEYFRGRKT